MDKKIVLTASDLLEYCFVQAGWHPGNGDVESLEKAVNWFLDMSMAITREEESKEESCFAVILRRSLLQARYGTRDISTSVGIQLKEVEEEFFTGLKKIGMTDYLPEVENFSLILSGESKREIIHVGGKGHFYYQFSRTMYHKIVQRRLLFSSKHGEKPKVMLIIENGKVIQEAC